MGGTAPTRKDGAAKSTFEALAAVVSVPCPAALRCPGMIRQRQVFCSVRLQQGSERGWALPKMNSSAAGRREVGESTGPGDVI